ncbi:hypothetical protein [Actinomadura sp. 3N407]|uniref:hypothetical protein n=1 Tax=Actinomadura sp. 3N407 TaxID=3457423 RepID=UPI003FCEDBCE
MSTTTGSGDVQRLLKPGAERIEPQYGGAMNVALDLLDRRVGSEGEVAGPGSRPAASRPPAPAPPAVHGGVEAVLAPRANALCDGALSGKTPLGPGSPVQQSLHAFLDALFDFVLDDRTLIRALEHRRPHAFYANPASQFWISELGRRIHTAHPARNPARFPAEQPAASSMHAGAGASQEPCRLRSANRMRSPA